MRAGCDRLEPRGPLPGRHHRRHVPDAGAVIAIHALAITWSVDALDPSGNLATVDCLAPLDESARDRDTVPDVVDNCPDVPNLDRRDLDLDGVGDRWAGRARWKAARR